MVAILIYKYDYSSLTSPENIHPHYNTPLHFNTLFSIILAEDTSIILK
jgi:hypothetical protein